MSARWRVKHHIKAAASRFLYVLGLLQAWQAFALRRRTVILMYHRVLSSEERRVTGSHPGIIVGSETFERQMATLKRRFNVLSVEAFADHLASGVPLPNSSCLITFDDGWRDTYTNALPILRKFGFPGLVFLPVSFIGRRRLFWREATTQLLVRIVAEVRRQPARRPEFRALLLPIGLDHVLDLPDDDPRASIIEAVAARQGLVLPVADTLLPALSERLGPHPKQLGPADGFLDWDEVRAMARLGIAFGGHGAEHLQLTRVSEEVAQNEIQAAREVIGRELEGAVPTFSYPNGDYSSRIVDLVRRAGYRLAFTTRPGFARAGDDPYAIRRINIHENATETTPMFLARVTGLF